METNGQVYMLETAAVTSLDGQLFYTLETAANTSLDSCLHDRNRLIQIPV